YPERERSIWLIASRFVFERGIASMHRSGAEILREFDIAGLLKMLGKPPMADSAAVEFLCAQELINDDLQGGYDVTNLCALLCANDISRYSSIAAKAPRVVTYRGRTKLSSVGDETGRRG